LKKELCVHEPKIAKIEERVDKRLIDENFAEIEASQVGTDERYNRGTSSHTIHVWWARRPHASMRLVVFASLCKNIGEDATKLLKELVTDEPRVMESARKMLKEAYKEPPRVLDMFGGVVQFHSRLQN
jgi:putative DNA methylase